jgi:hypothetical protein
MLYCSKCGVKVEDRVKKCPLCHLSIQHHELAASDSEEKYPAVKFKETMSNRQKRFISWIILTVIFLIGFLTVMTTNLLQSGNLSWAGYPMVSMGGAWLISTLLLFLFKSPLLIIIGNFFVLSGLLALIDVIDGRLQWYLVLGLPIIGMLAFSTLMFYLVKSLLKNRYALIISLSLIIIIANCFGLNLLASAYLGNVRVSWALYVAISLGPVSLLLVLYHFGLRKVIDLRKIFHF